MIWGVALLWVLPGEPIRARGLSERERYLAVARLRTNNAGIRNTHFKSSQVKELLVDVKFWLLFWIATLCMIANGPISTFLPIIINSFGFGPFNSLLLLMPCGFYSGTMCLFFCWCCYKFKNVRSWLFCVAETIAILSCLLLVLLPRDKKGPLLFGAIILPVVGASYGVLMSIQVANTAGYTKKSIASSGLFIGYCVGNFIGPLVFRPQDAPRYIPGFTVVIITSFISIVLMVIYRVICARDNRKRDEVGAESFNNAFNDDLTDKTNAQFRYIY
ncbi:unnamed protein product [Parascedosporium putredinis]|uniref:Uncharacterized protein n=1 Tax=Parascedosporium putredinis TaxID=1442378 RepID=A0A9P1MBV5_9PEZI|nr:unnamed protein product [Parascedosporium putredinis]CAI7997021.1 unnamed protein product [Parascedosporium putredinis]